MDRELPPDLVLLQRVVGCLTGGFVGCGLAGLLGVVLYWLQKANSVEPGTEAVMPALLFFTLAPVAGLTGGLVGLLIGSEKASSNKEQLPPGTEQEAKATAEERKEPER